MNALWLVGCSIHAVQQWPVCVVVCAAVLADRRNAVNGQLTSGMNSNIWATSHQTEALARVDIRVTRDFKQIATASSTTATGSIFFKNWDSAQARGLCPAVLSNPATWEARFSRSRWYVNFFLLLFSSFSCSLSNSTVGFYFEPLEVDTYCDSRSDEVNLCLFLQWKALSVQLTWRNERMKTAKGSGKCSFAAFLPPELDFLIPHSLQRLEEVFNVLFGCQNDYSVGEVSGSVQWKETFAFIAGRFAQFTYISTEL